jgi:hypothetical protein
VSHFKALRLSGIFFSRQYAGGDQGDQSIAVLTASFAVEKSWIAASGIALYARTREPEHWDVQLWVENDIRFIEL